MLDPSDPDQNPSVLRFDAWAASSQGLTKSQRSNLFLTSKKIYNEAMCFLYNNVTFIIRIYRFDHHKYYSLHVGLDKIQNLHIMLDMDLYSTDRIRENIYRKRLLNPLGSTCFANIARRSCWVTLNHLDYPEEFSPIEVERAVFALAHFTRFEELIVDCRFFESFYIGPYQRRKRYSTEIYPAGKSRPFLESLPTQLESGLGPSSQGTHLGRRCLRFRPMDHARNCVPTQS